MISYAQNFEDIMLARVFKEQKSGFYIDVGVWHPEKDSVTKYFYDLGWSGVNIEALPDNFKIIQEARPRDININAAASSKPGPLHFHEVKATGLSTSRDDYAEMHATAGFSVQGLQVETVSLKSVCEQYARGRTIDFLKIDVEGAEGDVVDSADWQTYRPRLLIIEATVPLSAELAFEDWEPKLLSADYALCYFDGLNRWYLRKEDAALACAFNAPPNPFDNYTLARVVELERELASIRDEAQALRSRAGRVRAALRASLNSLLGRSK